MAKRKQQMAADHDRGAAGKTPATKRAGGKPRQQIATAPVRVPRPVVAGNSFTLDDIPALAGALAQTPVGFVTGTVELPTPSGRDTGQHADKHDKSAVGVRQKFGELREALAEGWEIVQPIFARPLWSVSDDSITAFNFVLRRERTTRLVTVPAGRTVQRFIRDRQLVVDYRR